MRCLLVFPDTWLMFAPSVLQAARCLEERGHAVTTIALDNGDFDRGSSPGAVVWVPINRGRFGRLRWYRLRRLKAAVKEWRKRNPEPDLAIGFDSLGFLAAVEATPRPAYYSLEVSKDRFLKKSLNSGIPHLVTQTQERGEFLAGEGRIPVTFVQNAPILDRDPSVKSSGGRRLVYFGNMDALYALDDVILSLHEMEEFTLTLRGPNTRGYGTRLLEAHRGLVESGRLDASWEYIADDAVTGFLSEFDIGICLYDFSVIEADDFNFLTSPSGKMFSYFAAGLPCVGLDMPGLSPITEFKAGLQIRDTNPNSIANAVRRVRGDYANFSAGAVRAARAFDFRESFSRLLSSLEVSHQEGSQLADDSDKRGFHAGE